MFLKILLILAAVVVVILLVAAFKSGDFRIVRSATLAAPPAVAFDYINDLHKWQEVSPWAKLDPAAKLTYEGPRAGPGASFAWDGNNKIGAGRMTVIDSRPAELVRFRLDFLKPMACTNTAEFTFQPVGGQTLVTWSMSGRNNFVGRVVCLFMNMDKVVGSEFEKGLANLKALAEASVAK
jgi:hypothetical protein